MKRLVIIFCAVFWVFANCERNKISTNNEIPILNINKSDVIKIANLDFALQDEYTSENGFMIEDYIRAFTEFSPEILERSSVIELIECRLKAIPEEDKLYQGVGWTKTIEIKIKIKDTTILPADWEISGKTLYYYLGAGRVPGILVQTRQEHLFSGFINENIDIVINGVFLGIDEIGEPTFTKEVETVTASQFRDRFQEQFSKFGGRVLPKWAGKEVLKIEDNFRLYFGYVNDNDVVRDVHISYDDTSIKLKYQEDYFHAICAMISIFEPYLNEQQVQQLANSMVGLDNAINRFYLPSQNTYDVTSKGKAIGVVFRLRWGRS
jgi:hypothetical protein